MLPPIPTASLERALIVKSDRLAAESIERALRQIRADVDVVICATATAALLTLRDGNFGLGLFGLNLPDMDGLDLLSIVVERRLVRRIVAVSARCDERTQQLLRRHGVDGHFNPSVDCPNSLPAVLTRIIAGHRHGLQADPVSSDADFMPSRATELLTPAELKILATIGDGSDDRLAAHRLGLSPLTVHTHRKRIMRKLGVGSRPDLMRIAIQTGLVRITPTRVFRPGFDHALERNAAELSVDRERTPA
jgi:DNA-binding NarL/FixJ family response regulator